MTRIRLKILKHFLGGTRNGVSWSDIVKMFFGVSYSRKAKSVISRIEQADDYLRVYMRDLCVPLFWPAKFPFKSLQEILVETFYKDNWHHYFLAGFQVSSSDVVVDCGASEGLFALVVASRGARVFAIEPLPTFQAAMKLTFAKFPNVEIMPYALSSSLGVGSIMATDISSSVTAAEGGTPVKIETIDNLFLGRDLTVSFIKADLEGYDVEALKGAVGIIKKYSPRIAITTYHCKDHAEQISTLLKGTNASYRIQKRGIYHETGSPIMLHAWCE